MSLRGLRIQPARRSDALTCVALRRKVLAEREWFITLPEEFLGTADDEEERIRAHQGEHGLYLVARCDASPVVGLVTALTGALRRVRHAAKLEIMVDPTFRGQGVGPALLEACCGWADESPNIRKLGLTVFATNHRAIALYRSFGFVEEGRRVAEYQMEDGSTRDDLLMYRLCPPEKAIPSP